MKQSSAHQTSGSKSKTPVFRDLFPVRVPLKPFWQKTAPELVVDEEITLRPITAQDSERIYELVENNRAHLQEWLSWIEKVKTIQDCRSFIRTVSYRDIFAGKWVYGIWYQDKLAGLLDFNEGDKSQNQISLGYWISKEQEGKGIVTRSVSKCLDYVFEVQQLHRVVIKCATKNFRSEAIPLRLKFSWEGLDHEAGTVNGKTVDMVTYSMLYRDWGKEKKSDDRM
ncbi:MAG: GNAT family protein [Bacteroidia bacterium]|nr:GNAT family protein [Bacteroidia bacterium]